MQKANLHHYLTRPCPARTGRFYPRRRKLKLASAQRASRCSSLDGSAEIPGLLPGQHLPDYPPTSTKLVIVGAGNPPLGSMVTANLSAAPIAFTALN